MIAEGNVWRCKCGNIDYGEFPPEECSKCWKANSFSIVPEDMVEEIEGDMLLEEIKSEDLEDDE